MAIRNRTFHDWDLNQNLLRISLRSYKSQFTGRGLDRVEWSLSKKGKFDMSSYYWAQWGKTCSDFPYKTIWKTKIPRKVAFFICTLAHGKILTLFNLRRRGIITVDWCCTCKVSGKTNNLCLQCAIARVL